MRILKSKGFIIVCVLSLIVIAGVVIFELRTSWLQSYFFSRLAGEMMFHVEPGESNAIRFPSDGPYDKRLGYVDLPSFIDRLGKKGFDVGSQARFSPRLQSLTGKGIYTIYPEKMRAGLTILDRDSQEIFSASYPERLYSDFGSIPEVIVNSLLFIENQELLDPSYPYHNPAVEWDRLVKAVVLEGRSLIDRDERVPGGSTLATQMEKYRHSPDGITSSVKDKYRQIVSASLRSYMEGRNTFDAKRRIVLNYINSIPLGAVPGYGQINGVGDGLYGWYGADFDSINACLTGGAGTDNCPDIAMWGAAYKQTLSLFIAQRRPSFYLLEDNASLEAKTDSFIRVLAEGGVITAEQRDAALDVKLHVHRNISSQRTVSFVSRKAANAVRPRLLSLLKVPRLYELDLLDLTVKSTIDRRAQEEVSGVLRQISDPAYAGAAGLFGSHLLNSSRNPSGVIYSFTLYESTPEANLLRVQADNFDQPLNINEGVKLELGSSAKLRTLVTYLEVVAELHGRYANSTDEQLRAVRVSRLDRLSGWAVDYLLNAGDKTLETMLKAALQRSYSANPAEKFFTGGGEHTFANYDNKFDHRVVSVQEAFHNSVNLVFIRIMRDIVQYHIFQRPENTDLIRDVKDPRRREYLARFADSEGKIFLGRFYRKYQKKKPDAILEIISQAVRPVPGRLAAVFRSVRPDAGAEEFNSFIRSRLQNSILSDRHLSELYGEYSPTGYSLADRGFIARLHPLDLWAASYMYAHPEAGVSEVMEAGAAARQEVYEWLFKTNRKNAQDIRIRTLLEVEAFTEIHKAWERLGYPFDSLVPSYATAIGSSADRPSALAELVGIILNDGVKKPTMRIQELHFAKDTPYETLMKYTPEKGEQVLLPAVASEVRSAMRGVVEKGTAKRIDGAFRKADGTLVPVGGKTGTGDNRRDIYGPGNRLIRSDAINRTAVFVFYLGDRFFGTITAYVGGSAADAYNFTSLLPVQVLKTLAPKLVQLVENSGEEMGTAVTGQQEDYQKDPGSSAAD